MLEQHRKWISGLPILIVDTKMQVWRRTAGITRIPDKTDQRSSSDKLLLNNVGVPREVSVVIAPVTCSPDGHNVATQTIPAFLNHDSVSHAVNGCTCWRKNVHTLVFSPLTPFAAPSIQDLIACDSSDKNRKIRGYVVVRKSCMVFLKFDPIQKRIYARETGVARDKTQVEKDHVGLHNSTIATIAEIEG
jgi:hypothetical protein